MSMNILNISKEIKKINETLDYLKSQNNVVVNHLNTCYDVSNISDEIKSNMNDINIKLQHLNKFNINCKFTSDNKNYNEIKEFLLELNIDKNIINKIIFLDVNSLNEILIIDDEVLEKLEIPYEIINLIKSKIEEKIYISSIDLY